ncbi:hypothetical protein DPMN_116047 [Dreissena polymorpha]|uniref:Uncharacterized protein n=1 Tax=Dreissena polymorpha TaxID=45954 RepID=A0A9D4QUC6_DREPO|nr:hypothetical protein DPMN_116047 [Dreissena polymorpha]
MQGSSFGDICLMYYDYLYRNYKGDITVVFDGYKQGPTIKDITHLRRTKGKLGKAVKFSLETHP